MHMRFPLVLLVLFLLLAISLAFHVNDRGDWALENALAIAGVLGLVLTHKKFELSKVSLCMCTWCHLRLCEFARALLAIIIYGCAIVRVVLMIVLIQAAAVCKLQLCNLASALIARQTCTAQHGLRLSFI